MPSVSQSRGNLYLAALALAQRPAQEVRELQRTFFATGADILTISLPPLIPLGWNARPCVPFERMHLPAMPASITFSSVVTEDAASFLMCGTRQWLSLHDSLAQELVPGESVKGLSPPFPSLAGIFLGYGIPRVSPAMSLTNHDWRLLCIECMWERDAIRFTRFQYSVMMDRHLLSDSRHD